MNGVALGAKPHERPDRIARSRLGRGFGLLAIAMLAAGCSRTVADPTEVTEVRSVESPAGNLLAVGTATNLLANTVTLTPGIGGTPVSWASSDPTVVSVDQSGRADALAVGTAVITARTDGTGASISLTVVDPDFPGIETLMTDPHADQLIDALGGLAGTELRGSWMACRDAGRASDLMDMTRCLSDARSDLALNTESEKAPLRALLGLFLDWVERLLDLP